MTVHKAKEGEIRRKLIMRKHQKVVAKAMLGYNNGRVVSGVRQ